MYIMIFFLYSRIIDFVAHNFVTVVMDIIRFWSLRTENPFFNKMATMHIYTLFVFSYS